ncbi:MAG: membrane protein insertase YidC [Helicobacteraceae bacterium]|nr:membrane protein insertase YidC [Helicobacteraceae bacterium]
MIEKLSPTTRWIIFVAVLFAFITLYQRYFVEPQAAARQEANKIAQRQNASAPIEANAAPSVASNNAAPNAAGIVLSGKEAIFTVKTAISELTIDNLGRISQATLTGVVFKGEEGKSTPLLDPKNPRPLEIRFSDRAIHAEAFKTAYESDYKGDLIDASESPAELILTQTLSDITIVKTLTFYPDGHYDLKVKTSRQTDFFITTGFRPVAASDPMTVQGALVHTQNGTIETIEDGEAIDKIFSQAKMVSAFDRYYASLFFNYESPLNVVISKENGDDPLAFARSNGNLALSGYIGPKYVERLRAINPELTNAVEYGFFTFLSKPLFVVLEWIYSFIPNWGWAIVLFTILVKIVLFPLSHKGMVSMAKLKELAPKMKELQARYKDDKAKLQTHMMELYKKHGANPLGGCLPLLLQIPIFFAIYRILLNAIELKGANWFYIGDLSLKDPFFILPILMGAAMWFQQKITPSNFTDPIQEKLFKWLPVVFTVFFLFFPAGLVLYWLVNNIISIGQQWFVNKSIKLAKERKVEGNEKN